MSRTIKIKGVGRTTVEPDFVVLSLKIETKQKKYEAAIDENTRKITELNSALEKAGFEKDSVKTVSYNVRMDYSTYRDRKGMFQKSFEGYVCNNSLKIEFDFDSVILGKALNAISSCFSEPQMDISFTIKDKDAVSDRLLKSAAINAKRRAEILCSGCGAELGNLISIDYDWKEINFFSRADISTGGMGETTILSAPTASRPISPQPQIQPTEFNVSDSAVFVWEIK